MKFRSIKQQWGLASLFALIAILCLIPAACGDDDDDDEESDYSEDVDDWCSYPDEYDECNDACTDDCGADTEVCLNGECGGYFEDRCENPGDNNLTPTLPEYEEYCQCLTDCYKEIFSPCNEECSADCKEQYPCQ